MANTLRDLYCVDEDKCGHVEKDIFIDFDDIIKFKCPKCGGEMRNICRNMAFRLVYHPERGDVCDWGKGGYEKSRYFAAVDAANEKAGSKNAYKAIDADWDEKDRIGHYRREKLEQ